MSATPTTAEIAVEPARKRGGKLIWILLAVVVLGAAGGGGWWWWQGHNAAQRAPAKAPAVRAPAQYFPLEPAFVVNLADGDSVRYLQADVQLVTRDVATHAALEANAPAIRNRLLLLFGQQSSVQLSQRSGKERLQAAALAEVRQVLKGEGASDKVEAVIFTSLVTQ